MTKEYVEWATLDGKSGKVAVRYEDEPRPCDHHWEWINDHTIRCLRCFECKEGPQP